ncbi:MAG: cadherin-like domain-containing protein [Candidatus Thiodiazotropha sp. (ex Dulcina madagascariensis)]|nr:cadherin-like domain-containing protein [Candidatus Thiodiazotropha sp. (ex Dulcina madagascariensis)]
MIPQQIKITTITFIFILLFSACNKTDSNNNNSTNDGSSNGAPTANSQNVSGDEDTPLVILLTGSDPDSGDSLTFTLLSSPVNGLLSGSAPNLTYTPNHHFNGSDSFTFKASDGSLDSAAATVSITLNEVYNWANIGPQGGYVSSVTFHPTVSGEIWISGDDSSGFYRSTDGGDNWSLMTTPPADQATYAIRFDPNSPSTVYAPNHFGRGLYKTTDSGASWTQIGSGLPGTETDKRFYDLAVDPANSALLIVCLGDGLFKSTDSGATFSQVTTAAFGSDTDFRAVVIDNARIVVGSGTGRVYTSEDSGVTWRELTTTAYAPVTDLALTDNALYIAFALGTITKTTSFIQGGFSILNNSAENGAIVSGMWTRLAALSGASADTDKLYVGTVYSAVSNNWGFFESLDGGATFAKKVNGLSDESVFDIAIDPFDSRRMIFATINGGLFITDDSGSNWRNSSHGILATVSLGFAEDPADSQHLLISSTSGLIGTSKVFETRDGGSNWSEVTGLDLIDVETLKFVPNDSSSILAGTFRDGIYKTISGSGGQWSHVLSSSINVARFSHDRVSPTTLYAASYSYTAPAVPTDIGVYVSTDSGDNWQQRLTGAILNVIPHPDNGAEAVAIGTDIFATTDSFATAATSLGLAAVAPGEFFASAAFDPANPATLLVGSSTGELYVTHNYRPDGVGVTWRELTSPAQSVQINDIVIVNDGTTSTWYANGWAGDLTIQPDSTPGLMRSDDGGASWTFLNAGLYPSTLIWKFRKSATVAGRFYAGMWGGGFMRFDE